MDRRGLTMFETIAVIVAVVFILFIAANVLISSAISRQSAAQLKDSTQVRELHRAMVMWAQHNADEYPLPSRVDHENATVAEEGRAKDTTANIMSVMVHNGLITPEVLVSPAEVNRSIRVYRDYEFHRPRRAVRPGYALWDPGLSADFTAQGGGHTSYAHAIPDEARLGRWRNTFSPTEPVVGMRGPEITGVTRRSDGTVVPTFANPESNTFRMHRAKDRWMGNMAFNDNHVEYLTKLHLETYSRGGHEPVTYTNTGGKDVVDFLFYDEPDDATGLNMYLGIFIRAGERREEFRGIWD